LKIFENISRILKINKNILQAQITSTSKEAGNPSLKHPPPKKSRAMRSKKKTIIPPLKKQELYDLKRKQYFLLKNQKPCYLK